MREIKIGEKTIRVRATPLALLYYRQEFGSGLIGDLTRLQKMKKDPSDFDDVSVMQMTWALSKADAYAPGFNFPSFELWLSSLDSFDFSDNETLGQIMEEAADGFFRKGKGQLIKK